MRRKRQIAKVEPRRGWWRGPVMWALALALLAFALYANTLGHGFVIDDAPLISQNSAVTGLNWGFILSPYGYRPVRTFTYGLNYALGGTDPFGYHLLNVILHSLNVVVLFYLFLRWTNVLIVAGVAGLFFAVHPVQTAAVAYVSGRKDMLATLFVLLACHAYTSFRRARRPGFAVLTGFLFALAVMAKEVAIVLPVLLVLVDALVLESRPGGENGHESLVARLVRPFKRAPVFYGVCFVLLLVGAYYAMFVVEASRMTGFWGGSVWSHYGTSFKLFLHYAKLVIVPYPLIADYIGEVFGISKGFREPATIASIAFGVGYLYLALKIHRQNRLLSFGMLWFLVALIPVLQIVPFHELAADHFLYLPMVGFVLLLGAAVQFTKRSWGARVTGAVVAVIAVCFSVMTIDRNRDWKDEQTLWTETYRVAPGSYRANQNLGLFYSTQGETEKAIRHTERSIELDAGREQAWSNLGALYRVKASEEWDAGNVDKAKVWSDKAVERLKRSIEMNPSDLWAWANLGQAYRVLGLIAEKRGEVRQALKYRTEAIEYYQKAQSIGSDNPAFPLIWGEEAKIFMDAGYYDQAINYLDKALAAFPNRTDLLYSLGVCYFNLRQYSDAIPYFLKAVQTQPSIELWGMLAKSYEETGENYSAIQVYERALSQYPRSVEIHYNLGVLYHRIGDPDKAVQHLEQALQVAPRGPLAGNIERILEVIRDDS